jgi:hypothetical protein
MHPGLKVFVPCIAGTGILLIANSAISGEGWLVPMAVIVGAALMIASGQQRRRHWI